MALLKSDSARVGADVEYGWGVGGVCVLVSVELRPNAVWRRGRLFFRCPRCRARCTRVYVPNVAGARPACRTCWGLTYDSRAERTYRDTPRGRGAWAWMLGVTQRDSAYMETDYVRQRRYAACCARWAARRQARRPHE